MAARKHPSVEGQTFGDMRVIKEHTTGQLRSYYEGKCVCGRPVFVKKEYIHTKLTDRGHYYYSCRHDHLSKPHVKLGATRKDSELHPTYKSWESMRYRCLNKDSKDYPRYGGRGITICKPWDSFDNFLRDMGQRPEGTSLGRINNDGPYSPDNCRWETPKQQQNNTSYNVKIKGISVEEVADKTGLTPNAIYLRRLRGATDDEIVNTPVHTPRASALKPTVPDLGERSGKLVIVGTHRDEGTKEVVYTCKCDCGNTKDVTRRNFKKTKSCGCLKKESAKTKAVNKPSSISQEYDSLPLFSSNAVGKKYAKLTIKEVRRKTLKPGVYRQYAKCLCDCGNETIVAMGNLTGDPQHTTSCGCAKVGAQGPKVSTIPLGAKFGKLLVCFIKNQHNTTTMHCRCDCGTMIEVAAFYLKNGSVTSCGCDSMPKMGAIKLVDPPKPAPKIREKAEVVIEIIPSRIKGAELKIIPSKIVDGPSLGNTYKSITYKGETHSVKQWAAKLGLNLSTVLSRMSRGATNPDNIFATESAKPGSKPGCKKPEGSGRGFSVNVGDTFGQLTIKSLFTEPCGKQLVTKAVCICTCGNEKTVLLSNLKSRKITSCGCKTRQAHNKGVYSVVVGQRFGRLVITDLFSDNNTSFATCQCDCGEIKRVALGNLKRGQTVSCGCATKDRMKTNNPGKKKAEAA